MVGEREVEGKGDGEVILPICYFCLYNALRCKIAK